MALIMVWAMMTAMVHGEIRLCIDKNRMCMFVINAGNDSCRHDTVAIYPISCGRGYGHKLKDGDMRTPEGTFSIVSFSDSRDWGHDFLDGHGYIRGAYGPWFMRLSFGHGIGIHGTHDPSSMGFRASEGCIRLRNADVAALKKMVRRGTVVEILPDTLLRIQMPDSVPQIKPVSSTAAQIKPIDSKTIIIKNQ
ncbi:MAG: L,D-transpeptidase [Bacteroidales bacterium]|nr:L,D-transpeptidase [Candidatus Liminaster caballi]